MEVGRTLAKVHSQPKAPFVESGLFFEDRWRFQVDLRFQDGLLQAAEALRSAGQWPFEDTPEKVASWALEQSPLSENWAVLHSNPGPTHAFVMPSTGLFTGIIDFGDAYISHRALDLRPWRDPQDQDVVLEGYAQEVGPRSQGFIAIARIASLSGFARGAWRGGNMTRPGWATS